MFSNRSVSVQPSAPPIENAGVPDDTQRVRRCEERGPCSRGPDPGSPEGGRRVPDGRLVRALEEETVELALDRAELEPVGRVVLCRRRACEGDRLEGALVREVAEQTRLTDRREIRRIASLDRGRQDGRRVVAARRVLHADVRVELLEPVENGLEPLLLGPGPDPDDRKAPRDRLVCRLFRLLRLRCRPDACGGERGEQGDAERSKREAKRGHATSFCFGWS